jgi:hypothetical protein
VTFLPVPSWLGDGDKEIEIVYGEEKNILYWAGWSNQGRTQTWHDKPKPNEPTKEEPL